MCLHFSEFLLFQKPGDVFQFKAHGVLPHAVCKRLVIVRENIDDDEPATGFEDAGRLTHGLGGFGEVAHDQHDHRRIDHAIVNGQVVQVALAQDHVGVVGGQGFGRCEHLRGVVHGDDTGHIGCDGGGELAGAAAQIGDDHAAVEQGHHGRFVEGVAEIFFAQLIPFAGGAGKERLGSACPLGELVLQAHVILRDGGPVGRLLARQLPEVACPRFQLIDGHPIEVRPSLAAGANPLVAGEHLEMSADGGLGQLNDVAQFQDAQLVIFQKI